MEVFVALGILGLLGILFGVGLALASQRLAVPQDFRFEQIQERLPGANCGACGFPGCAGFTEALIQGGVPIEKCAVSPQEARDEIAKILGVSVQKKIKQFAVLHCHGDKTIVSDRFIYCGVNDCFSASLIMNGQKSCIYGCLGFGSCVSVCPTGAISLSSEGLPVIQREKCIACGKCLTACPRQLFSLVSAEKQYIVRCRSREFGKKVLDICKVGCIGCRRCEQACPENAITIVDHLPVIDYSRCTNQGKCAQVCPTQAISKK